MMIHTVCCKVEARSPLLSESYVAIQKFVLQLFRLNVDKFRMFLPHKIATGWPTNKWPVWILRAFFFVLGSVVSIYGFREVL